MDNLGEDLVLLSIKPDQGLLFNRRSLEFGLMGSELVRLAALGRIAITADGVAIRDLAPTGDAELHQALHSLASTRRPPQAKTWVSSPRRGITDAYLARLTRGGVVQPEQRRDLFRIKYTVWRITDPGRYANARGTLDAIARSGGGPIDSRAAAFAGLAHAAGVTGLLYPGRANRDVRWRFEQIAKGTQSGPAVRATQEALDLPLEESTYTEAAARAASDAAMLAAAEAATAAAVQAATEAAVHAAVHATMHASTDSGSHDSGSAGGHHHH